MHLHINQNLLQNRCFLQKPLRFVYRNFTVRNGELILPHQNCKPLAQRDHVRVDAAFRALICTALVKLHARTRQFSERLCNMRVTSRHFQRGNSIYRHKTVGMLIMIRVITPQRRLGFSGDFTGSLDPDRFDQSFGVLFQIIPCCIYASDPQLLNSFPSHTVLQHPDLEHFPGKLVNKTQIVLRPRTTGA